MIISLGSFARRPSIRLITFNYVLDAWTTARPIVSRDEVSWNRITSTWFVSDAISILFCICGQVRMIDVG